MSQPMIHISRSYTAIGDVTALFVVLPLLVRTLQLHDMTIVIIAVLSQAVKSLIYFFAGDKSSIYYVIGFSMLHCLNTQPLRSSMTKLVGQGESTQFQLISNVCRRRWCYLCLRGRGSSHFWICNSTL